MILFLARLLHYLRFMVNHQKYGHAVDIRINKYDFVASVAYRMDLGYGFKAVPTPEMKEYLRSVGARIGYISGDYVDLENEVRGTQLRDPWVKFYFPTAESAIVFKLEYM